MTATRKKLLLALVFIATSALALLLTLLLLRSPVMAIGLYGLLLGMGMVLSEPFVGLVNYFIFMYIRPQEFIPGFVGFPIMMAIAAATSGVTILVMLVRRSLLGLSRAPQNYLMLWFFIAIIASHVVRFNIFGLTNSFNKFLPTFLMYYLIVTLNSSETKLKISLYLLLVLTLFLAGDGIYQYYTGTGIAGQTMYEGRIQSIGIFSDPNDLAMALLIVLPLTVLHMISGNVFVKLIHFVFFAALTYAVYLTDSRGGVLAWGAVMFLFFTRRYGLAKGVMFGGVMFALIFVAGPDRMGDISTGEASAFGRIEAWTVGIDLMQSYPLFGVGAQQFTEYHFRTVHNSVLLCASELGLFGLYPWVMMFYLSIKNLHFISNRSREDGDASIAFLADAVNFAIVAFLAAAMFLSRTYNEVPYILLAMAASVTTLFVRKRPQQKFVLVDKRDFKINIGITIGCVIALKLFLIFAW